ncbi:MAG: alpha/beta hydrolase [Alphaproteobacteria bacterium]
MSSLFPLLDQPQVLGVLFHPRRGFESPAGDGRAVRIPVEGTVFVGGKIFAPTAAERTGRNDAPVILFFHGNGEIASDYDEISRLYTQLGITLFVVDYRGYGLSTGTPTATALIADARVIGESVRSILSMHGTACDRLFVMGRSLGSAAAIEVALHDQANLSGLIIESGFADTLALVERIGDLHFTDGDDARYGFDNLGKIARVTLPTLLLHGEEDWIIPVSDARALHRQSGAVNKRLLTVPGAGHNDLLMLGRRAYFEAIASVVFGE